MGFNKNFARLVDGKIEYAPESLPVEGGIAVSPTWEQYLAAGWKRLVDLPAPSRNPPPGTHWERAGWCQDRFAIFPAWRIVPDARPLPRVFVTADLVEALMEEGAWEKARKWIVEHGILDLVLATKEFNENNENFKAGREALQRELEWTDEQVEELLARCVKEEQ